MICYNQHIEKLGLNCCVLKITMDMGNEQKRVLLLMSPATYRAGAFLNAARGLNLEVVVGIDLPETLSEYWHVPLGLDFTDPGASLRTITEFARQHPIHAVVSVDDSATELAALAGTALDLAHNSPQAAEAARDKLLMRTLMSAGGTPCPIFRPFSLSDDPAWGELWARSNAVPEIGR